MKFEAPIWRNGDANCCPSGGRVKIDLILREERLEIETFLRVPPDG